MGMVAKPTGKIDSKDPVRYVELAKPRRRDRIGPEPAAAGLALTIRINDRGI
jgi:hypothetical protein